MDSQDYQFLTDHFEDVKKEQAEISQRLAALEKLMPNIKLGEPGYNEFEALKDLFTRINTGQFVISGATALIGMRLENIINESK